MRGSFTARTPLSLAAWDAGPEFEVEMVVTFTVQPESGDGWNDPREPASVEDIRVRLFSHITKAELACPSWVEEWFADDKEFHNWLLSEAAEQDESVREDAAERRREMRLEAEHG